MRGLRDNVDDVRKYVFGLLSLKKRNDFFQKLK